MLNRNELNHALKQHNIDANLDSIMSLRIEGSITNTFFTLTCLKNNNYLIRVNGKLWPPFTRENEHFNLNLLKSHAIPTNVIHNNHLSGFQICTLPDNQYRFNNFANKEQSADLVSLIGTQIKRIHNIGHFKNDYDLLNTINNTFKRMSVENKKNLLSFYPLIISIINTINNDQTNLVSSHNDLLPSSIYYDNKQVAFIDWEYAGMNHRSYDLAFFSTQANLTTKQQNMLLAAYDPENQYDTHYYVNIMKIIVDFLLLQWQLAANNPSMQLVEHLTNTLHKDLLIAEQSHVYYLKAPQGMTSLFQTTTKTTEKTDHKEFKKKARL